MLKAFLILALVVPVEAAVAVAEPGASQKCEHQTIPVWVNQQEDDTSTDLVFLAKAGDGDWTVIPKPPLRLLARTGGKKVLSFQARTVAVDEIQSLLAGAECAEIIGRIANRNFGWATVDDDQGLLSGQAIALFEDETGVVNYEHQHVGWYAPVPKGFLYSLEGDDLLVTQKGQGASRKSELFALRELGETLIPLVGTNPSDLEGDLRSLAEALKEQDFKKIKNVFASTAPGHGLRVVIEGKQKGGAVKLMSYPEREGPVAPRATLGLGKNKEGQLLFFHSQGLRVLELDGWPTQVKEDGDLLRFNVLPGRHQLSIQLVKVFSGVASSGNYTANRLRYWTPPLTLKFEVQRGFSYRLERNLKDDNLHITVVQRDASGAQTPAGSVTFPWPGNPPDLKVPIMVGSRGL